MIGYEMLVRSIGKQSGESVESVASPLSFYSITDEKNGEKAGGIFSGKFESASV